MVYIPIQEFKAFVEVFRSFLSLCFLLTVLSSTLYVINCEKNHVAPCEYQKQKQKAVSNKKHLNTKNKQETVVGEKNHLRQWDFVIKLEKREQIVYKRIYT